MNRRRPDSRPASKTRNPRESFLSTTPQVHSPYPPSTEPALSVVAAEKRASVRNNILFFVALVLLVLLGFQLRKELEILYVSALFAVVLMPVVGRITSLNVRGYRPSRGVAIAALMIVTLGALTIFFLVGLPPVLDDLRGFMADLPHRLPLLLGKAKSLPIANKIGLDQIAGKVEGVLSAVGTYVVNALPAWLSHIFDVLTAIFLCIYFMLEGEHAYNFFLSLFPSGERRRLDITLKKAELKMSKWLLGQGLLMLILGIASTVTFGFLHVRYFILLGVLMGLLNIIPIAGGVVTIILVAIVAAFDSWAKMAGVLIFYAVYINLENAFLTPRIMRSSVNLMGLTVLVALLLGTALAGIVGALVAVPTAALVAVLLEEYAVQN